MFNILQDTDSYKLSMDKQYPSDTMAINSYIEARKGDTHVIPFGAQYFIKTMLDKPITRADVDEAEQMYMEHVGAFDRSIFDHIVNAYGGYWPVTIDAVPEGTPVGIHQVLAQVRSVVDDPKVRLMTTWLETRMLSNIWYGTTVATNSYNIKQLIKGAMLMTGADLSGLPFKLHDFGSRGASTQETAALGGMAHLVNFMGTDTTVALFAAKRYYGAKGAAGFSIPAAEHSTITSWGRDREFDAYRNMINLFGGEGKIYAVVSDSYDYTNAVQNGWSKILKPEVVNAGGTLVVRPDSGDPVESVMMALRSFADSYGYTTTSKGFKVICGVRVIQGDGISASTIVHILDAMMAEGFSVDNVAFGMGGALLQKVTRDDLGFAMKCSARWNGVEWLDVQKDPKTDPSKKSKAGVLSLVRENGELRTIRAQDSSASREQMVTLYHMGEIFEDNLDNIRARAA